MNENKIVIKREFNDNSYVYLKKIRDVFYSENKESILLYFEDALFEPFRLNSIIDSIIHPILDKCELGIIHRLRTSPDYRKYDIAESIHRYFYVKFASRIDSPNTGGIPATLHIAYSC